jgi:hypothetical protein
MPSMADSPQDYRSNRQLRKPWQWRSRNWESTAFIADSGGVDGIFAGETGYDRNLMFKVSAMLEIHRQYAVDKNGTAIAVQIPIDEFKAHCNAAEIVLSIVC